MSEKLSNLGAAGAGQTTRLVAVQGTAVPYDDVLLSLDPSLSAASDELAVVYGTAASTAAQGNDTRIVGALQAANNLADLASAATARGNLALVASATTDTTDAGNISSGTLADARLPATMAGKTFSSGIVLEKATADVSLVSEWLGTGDFAASDGDGGILIQAGTTPTVTLPPNPVAGQVYIAIAALSLTVTFATAAPSGGGAAPPIAWLGSSAVSMTAGQAIVFRFQPQPAYGNAWFGCSA